jgi:hypothetical protein
MNRQSMNTPARGLAFWVRPTDPSYTCVGANNPTPAHVHLIIITGTDAVIIRHLSLPLHQL